MAVFVLFAHKGEGRFDQLFSSSFLVQRVNFASNEKVIALVGRWALVGYVIATS